jgi:hypothetical protein
MFRLTDDCGAFIRRGKHEMTMKYGLPIVNAALS